MAWKKSKYSKKSSYHKKSKKKYTKKKNYAIGKKSWPKKKNFNKLIVKRGVTYKAPFGDMMSAKFKFVGTQLFTIPPTAATTLWYSANVLDLNVFATSGTIGTTMNTWVVPPGFNTWLNGFYKCRINGIKVRIMTDHLGSSAEGTAPAIGYTPYSCAVFSAEAQGSTDIGMAKLPIQRFAKWKTMTQPGSSSARQMYTKYQSTASIVPDYVNRESNNVITITPTTGGVAPAPTFAVPNLGMYLTQGLGNMSGKTNLAGITTGVDVKIEFTIYLQAWEKIRNDIIP